MIVGTRGRGGGTRRKASTARRKAHRTSSVVKPRATPAVVIDARVCSPMLRCCRLGSLTTTASSKHTVVPAGSSSSKWSVTLPDVRAALSTAPRSPPWKDVDASRGSPVSTCQRKTWPSGLRLAAPVRHASKKGSIELEKWQMFRHRLGVPPCEMSMNHDAPAYHRIGPSLGSSVDCVVFGRFRGIARLRHRV